MQKDLSQMSPSEVSTLILPLVQSFECECCGSRDISHDVDMCKQAAYAIYDGWRAEEIKAGRWDVETLVTPIEEVLFSTRPMIAQ